MIQQPYFLSKDDACISVIEKIISDHMVTNIHITSVSEIQVSPDIYKILTSTVNHITHGHTAFSLWLAIGSINVKIAPNYKNLLFIGDKNEFKQFLNNTGQLSPEFWSNQLRAQIDREVERILLGSGKR